MGLYDLLLGVHTDTDMKTTFNMPATPMNGDLDSQQDQLDDLFAEITAGGAGNNLRMARILRFRSILTKWQRKDTLSLTGYDTADDIQTQMLAISETAFI